MVTGRRSERHPSADEAGFAGRIAHKEQRKIEGRRQRHRSAWFWAGMFGLVGWSVSVPMLVMLYVGILADRHWPGQVSWTLTGLVIGMALGCLNAWYWVTRESGNDD